MYHGSEAVTAFSVQGRSSLRFGGGCGGGLSLASATSEKQADENDCEIMKWFEFFHGASVSNEHATSFAQLKVICNAGCRFENETDSFRFREKVTGTNVATVLAFLEGNRINPSLTSFPTTDLVA